MAVVQPERPEDKYLDMPRDELVVKVIETPTDHLMPGENKPTDDELDEWPVSTLALWLSNHEVENPHLHLDD